MPNKISLSELKHLREQGALKEASGDSHSHGAPASRFTPVPMFLPTRTFGHHVASVVTRQKFMDTTIGRWIAWRTTRIAAIAVGVLAVILIPTNIYLAAAAGLGAGWLYGQHVWATFYVTKLMAGRRLLEST